MGHPRVQGPHCTVEVRGRQIRRNAQPNALVLSRAEPETGGVAAAERVMTASRPIEILNALIQGLDPQTGEPLEPDSPLHRVEVLRALLAAVTALEQSAARAQRRAQMPDNVGRPWSEAEEAQLAAGFRAGESPAALAGTHRRTLRAIEARLERLGLLHPEQRRTRGGFTGVSEAVRARGGARPRAGPRTRR